MSDNAIETNRPEAAREGKRARAVLALSALVWCVMLLASAEAPTISLGHLGPDRLSGSDHYSHIFATVLFLDHGFDIYRRPIRELCLPGSPARARAIADRLGVNPQDVCWTDAPEPLVINWAAYPRPYPPGQLLYFMPEALAFRWGGASFAALNSVTVCKLILVAHLCLLLVIRLTTGLASRPLAWLINGLAYLALVPWAAMGFYDAAAIALLLLGLLALRRGRNGQALVWGASSLLLHYRAVWYLPLFVYRGYHAWRATAARHDALPTPARARWPAWLVVAPDRLVLLGAGLLALAALVALFTVMPHLERLPVNNGLNVRLLSPMAPATWSLLVLTAGIGTLLAVRRHWLLLVQVLWCELVIVQAPQAMPWHAMFLLPMVLLPCALGAERDVSTRTERATLMLVWFVLFAALAFASPLDARWMVSLHTRLSAS